MELILVADAIAICRACLSLVMSIYSLRKSWKSFQDEYEEEGQGGDHEGEEGYDEGR